MITLNYDLPETFDLVSIHKKWNGEWLVCVCIRPVRCELGSHYGSAEHRDITEALRLAIERVEAKHDAPAYIAPAKPVNLVRGLNIGALDL